MTTIGFLLFSLRHLDLLTVYKT